MRTALLTVLVLTLGSLGACGGGSEAGSRPRVSFITNGVDPFWDLAIAGAEKGGEEFDVQVNTFCPPTGAINEQTDRLEDELTSGVDGIAISPIDASAMVSVINEYAAQVPVITHDSDSPDSKRLCFIGCDNYAAGRAVGTLVKKALPDGGQVVLCIGRLEQDNAQKRRQGVIDELFGRDDDSTRRDANDGPLEGGGYTVLTTLVDNFERTEALSKAEDALTSYPDLAAFVGLFAYNPPTCLEAIKNQGRAGEIKVIGFDEHRSTIQGILSGDIVGTVSQNPYQYGYESVRVLKSLIDGDRSVLPADGTLRVPFAVYEKHNAQELLDLLDEIQGD